MELGRRHVAARVAIGDARANLAPHGLLIELELEPRVVVSEAELGVALEDGGGIGDMGGRGCTGGGDIIVGEDEEEDN